MQEARGPSRRSRSERGFRQERNEGEVVGELHLRDLWHADLGAISGGRAHTADGCMRLDDTTWHAR